MTDDPFAGRYDTPEPRTRFEARIFEVFGSIEASLPNADQEYLYGVLEELLIENENLNAQLNHLRSQKAA